MFQPAVVKWLALPFTSSVQIPPGAWKFVLIILMKTGAMAEGESLH